jgi:integrase
MNARQRIYRRGKRGILWGDFRDLPGGKQMALIPPGQKQGTTDPVKAEELAAAEVVRLTGAQRDRAALGLNPKLDLVRMGDLYLSASEADGTMTPASLHNVKKRLVLAARFFTAAQFEENAGSAEWAARRLVPGERNLATIKPTDVREWDRWLSRRRGKGGRLWAPQTRRHALNALSGLYKFAISEGLVREDRNPVRALKGKPVAPRSNTPLREAWEIALFLAAAVDAGPLLERRGSGVAHCVYELLAFYIYTGARAAEVANAQVGDAHPHASRLEIRASKIRHGHAPVTRIIALPPALAEALAAYTKRTGKIGGRLFETTLGNRVEDCQRAIDFVAERAGFGAGFFTTRMFRTAFATYYATVDGVSANQVRAALGHRGRSDTFERIYDRAQLLPERMGPALDFSLERWRHMIPTERLQAVESWVDVRQWADSRETVRLFLEAIEGMREVDVIAAGGIDHATLYRLRRGQRTAKPDTVAKMEAFLHASGRKAG